jgi:hypothetical protein
MIIINDDEVTYKDCSRLRQILENEGIKLKPPEGDGNYDDLVIAYIMPKEGTEVEDIIETVIWPLQGNNKILRFRVILIKESLEKHFTSEQFNRFLNEVYSNGQNFDFYGHIALKNMFGVTLEYGLDTTGGVLSHNIVNAARNVAEGAQWFKRVIIEELDFLS